MDKIDYKKVAEALRFAYKQGEPYAQENLDAAIALCERMAAGELVERPSDEVKQLRARLEFEKEAHKRCYAQLRELTQAVEKYMGDNE